MKYIKRVWVGFSDGKPHMYLDANAQHVVAVFPTKWQAKIAYEDVRRAELVVDEPPKKRS